MPKLRTYMEIGICGSYGDGDYSVRCSAADLTPAEVREIRAVIPVAIATLEKYLQEAMAKHQPAAQQASPPATDGRSGT